MKRNVLLYGLVYGLLGGVLIAALRWSEYEFLVGSIRWRFMAGWWRRCSRGWGSGWG